MSYDHLLQALPDHPQPEVELPPREPDPAETEPVEPLAPDPTAPEQVEAVFRRTAQKGRQDRIEVIQADGTWKPVGVWVFENYPELSGEALKSLLIEKGLPEVDANWFGIQRALRLGQTAKL